MDSEQLNEYLKRRLKDTKILINMQILSQSIKKLMVQIFLILPQKTLKGGKYRVDQLKISKSWLKKLKGVSVFFSRAFIYSLIIPNTYLFLCFSFLLLIVKPAQKTHSRYRRATRCVISSLTRVNAKWLDLSIVVILASWHTCLIYIL